MDARHFIERAENALRTGQTENLFPVIARRALEKIAEEKTANRAEWEKISPEAAAHVRALRMIDAWQDLTAAVNQAWHTLRTAIGPAIDAVAAAFETVQGDYQLAAPAARN